MPFGINLFIMILKCVFNYLIEISIHPKIIKQQQQLFLHHIFPLQIQENFVLPYTSKGTINSVYILQTYEIIIQSPHRGAAFQPVHQLRLNNIPLIPSTNHNGGILVCWNTMVSQNTINFICHKYMNKLVANDMSEIIQTNH